MIILYVIILALGGLYFAAGPPQAKSAFGLMAVLVSALNILVILRG